MLGQKPLSQLSLQALATCMINIQYNEAHQHRTLKNVCFVPLTCHMYFFFLPSPDIYSSIRGLFLNYSSYNIWLDCGCAGSHCLMNEPLAFCRWCYQQLFECCMFTCIYPALRGKGWSLTQGKRERYCSSSKVSGTALPRSPSLLLPC